MLALVGGVSVSEGAATGVFACLLSQGKPPEVNQALLGHECIALGVMTQQRVSSRTVQTGGL